MKKLNLNSMIGFKLNDYGKDIYYHRHDELNSWLEGRGCEPVVRDFPKVDEKGLSYFQIWQFMDIYGNHSGMGKPEYWTELNFYIDDKDLDDIEEKTKTSSHCPWCMNSRGKTNLEFSIIDDDFGQYVHYDDINFCPFCGRKLKED